MRLIEMLDEFFATAPKEAPPEGKVWAAVFDADGNHTGWTARYWGYRTP